MIRVLVVAGVAVAAGAAAIWRWCTSESPPATDPAPAGASRHELGRPRPAREVEGNREKGIYAWHADQDGQSALSKAGLKIRNDGLVYIGRATESYDYRIVQCHLRGTVRNHPRGTRGYGSTLRRSLAAILYELTERASEQQVTDFMTAHLQVALTPMNGTADSIRREESKLIEHYQPALNIEGSDDDNAMALRRMRRVLKTSVPELFRGESA